MNTQMPTTRIESGKHNLRIKVLLEKLRTKLKNFSVLDRTGHFVGEVKDVKLDASRQLNLVVSQNDSYSFPRLFLLRSKHIQQVDSVTKSLFVDISKAEMDQFAEYAPPESAKMQTSGRSNSSATQLPEVVDQNAASTTDNISHGILDNTLETSSLKAVDSGQEVRYYAEDMPTIAESEYNQEEQEMEASLESQDTEIVEEEVIRLLEERLIVDRNKRKVGEVIVRKEIETRMVQVPVRYEKLIVEQISPERKQLAEIELEGEEISGLELIQSGMSADNQTQNTTGKTTVSGEFKSPKSASLFLNAIALQRHHGCAKVRVELVLEDAELQKTYEEWFARCSGS
jgi:stress response protein YsnF/sporulation protein YlmC with PRC-barrel domain